MNIYCKFCLDLQQQQKSLLPFKVSEAQTSIATELIEFLFKVSEAQTSIATELIEFLFKGKLYTAAGIVFGYFDFRFKFKKALEFFYVIFFPF